jgi:hypothetical protein
MRKMEQKRDNKKAENLNVFKNLKKQLENEGNEEI